MSEQSHKAAVITAMGAVIAALIGVFAVVYVHECRKTNKTSGPGIYVHFANDAQRALAYQIKSKLEAAGYYVPVVKKADAGFRRTKVKYFPNSKESGADYLVNVLHSWGVVDAEKVPVEGYMTDPQHYEIWFGQTTSNTNAP
jgi:hypothetical protein